MEPSLGLIGALVNLATHLLPSRHRVRVEVHRAFLVGDVRQKAFIRITNLSDRDVVVVRIWFDSRPAVEVVRLRGTGLPLRIRPEDRWETWWEIDSLDPMYQPYLETLARVELSSGKVIRSRATRSVAPMGVVPGS